MFIHDNGNLHVMSATRCGHTSMRKYLGFEELSLGAYVQSDEWMNEWINSTTRRVLVLRNPIDRWKSAEVFNETGWFKHHGPSNGMDKDLWIWIHREPFLISIPRYVNFEIIPFENLSDYLPWGEGTLASNSNNINRHDAKGSSSLREELIQYRYFRKHCKIISPEEWKQLTP